MSSSGRRRSVSDWAYVAIAYTVIWGALALYALVLARRVSQAREVSSRLRESLQGARSDTHYPGGDAAEGDGPAGDGDTVVCDVPPAP